MKPQRILSAATVAALALVLAWPAGAAPGRFGGGAIPVAKHGGHWSGHSGGSWGGSRHGGYHHGGSHWGWGLGLAIGLPWALGYYDPYWGGPYWGPAYYPPRAYVPVPVDPCAQDEDCLRERLSRSEAPLPTTQVPAPAPGTAEGMPTQRPLHLNYCESAKAWFPQVSACPEGWRFVPPRYDTGG